MIGGNTNLILKTKTTTVNDIGENVAAWAPFKTIKGFLDLMSEQVNRNVYNSKITDSSHVFICDYQAIGADAVELKAECDGQEFDVEYIDDPMKLHKHLEIFLKYIGD